MSEIPEFGIIRENEERRDGGCGIVYDPQTQLYAVGKQTTDGLLRMFSGGINDGEDVEMGTLREVTEESGLHDFAHVEKIAEAMAHYRNNLRNVNRVAKATCFLIILNSSDLIATKLEEHEKFSLAWESARDILDNWQTRNANHDYDHWMYFLNKAIERVKLLP